MVIFFCIQENILKIKFLIEFQGFILCDLQKKLEFYLKTKKKYVGTL